MTSEELPATRPGSRAPVLSGRSGYRRVSVPLKARFMQSDGTEHEARIRTISAADCTFVTHAPVTGDESIVLYIDLVGRLEGTVRKVADGTVHVVFANRRSRRLRTADTLIWLVNGGKQSLIRRNAMRIRQDRAAHAVTQDGRTLDCRILDISMTGASLAVSDCPALGTILTIGKMRARVVRRHESGVGVEFIRH